MTCAPYNFIPFADPPLLCGREELPPHNAIDPALKTGEIHFTMTARMPVFVSDGAKQDPHFFRGADGRFALPGATIRGMVRANMRVLGFGTILAGNHEDMENLRLYYRDFSAARDSLRYPLRNRYMKALDIEFGEFRRPDKSIAHYSIPHRVQAGYLRKTEKGGYEILPVPAYYRVAKSLLDPCGLGTIYAQALPVDYQAAGETVTAIQPAGDGAPPQDMLRGTLLCPGVDSGGDGTRKNANPPAHRYVFPSPAEGSAPLAVSEEDELFYRIDWENRRNSLKGGTSINREKIPYDPDFWKLPDESGKPKPVFYIQKEDANRQPHIYFGMSRFPRIGYDHMLADGLPRAQRKAAQEGAYPYDYVRAILGYAGQKDSYRSRVYFSDCPAQGEPEEEEPFEAVLGVPKPSWFAGYTKDGRPYSENFQLRGQKRFWPQRRRGEIPPPNESNAASRLRPLKSKTVFAGVIRYWNLHPHELGLLLWALRLERNCCQIVGMGKPFGLGRMVPAIDGLHEYDMNTLYRSLEAGPEERTGKAADSRAAEYIETYKAFAREKLGLKSTEELLRRPDISAFFYMCKTLQESETAAYMHIGDKKAGLPNEYQNLREPLPTVAEIQRAKGGPR